MKTLHIRIKTDPLLVDALSDYLVGMHDAVTEFSVDDDGSGSLLQAFVEKDIGDDQVIAELGAQISSFVNELADIFSCGVPEVSVELLEDDDWAENWKAYFKPFEIVDGLVIAPTWEEYVPRGGEQVIVMDPGMAFGTGHHATTRLCLELMKGALPPGGRVLDVGTGTGILAMAALLWGASGVVAIDNDGEAVAAARTNAERNGLADRMEVSDKPIAALHGTFDLVIANIVHDVLVGLADHLADAATDGGLVLLSGLITGEQSSNLERIFVGTGFELKRQLAEDQWCALLFQKRGEQRAESG